MKKALSTLFACLMMAAVSGAYAADTMAKAARSGLASKVLITVGACKAEDRD